MMDLGKTENVALAVVIPLLSSIQSSTNTAQCAHWIPSKDRKVLFVELLTWDMYTNRDDVKKKSEYDLAGESYVSATWDYALRMNGFQVDFVNADHFEKMTPSEMSSYHRIFFDIYRHFKIFKWHPQYTHHDVLCRVRPMFFWGRWLPPNPYNNQSNYGPYDSKQMLVPYPEEWNTFMGFFPHNFLNVTTLKAERGRTGFLLGKKPEYFAPYHALIQRLVSEGFELHSTCSDKDFTKCPFPSEVVQHTRIKPAEFGELMSKFSFMLGFGKVSANLIKLQFRHL
jgi:hypothetical protein